MTTLDRFGDFFREKTARRAIALVVFITLIVLFREAFVLFGLFVAFQSGFGGLTNLVVARTKWSHKRATLTVLGGVVVVFGTGIFFGAEYIVHHIKHVRENFPRQIAELQHHPLYERAREHLPDSGKLAERARDYSEHAIHFVSALGHLAMSALIAAILAVIFTLEHEELVEVPKRVAPTSLMGTLLRWLAHLCEAIRITIQLQVIVAAVNTVTTLPVLLMLGIRHVPALMILIFASGLIPVVGNIISGTVLALLAYQAKGFLGVGVFVALTFLLHKIEAYYLNPRLTSRHVKLPGFVIVVSLIAWEHLLGFAGLFVSFPFLYVASKIRLEMMADSPKSE